VVGRSRGGRTTKIHALSDAKGRLIAILLTGGEAHDCPVAERLIRRAKPSKCLVGDKAYDSAELREELDERGTKPVIPNRSNRKQPFSFNKRLHKLRWRIESVFNS
jgi:IS5 family transposase